jgi:hypothetical protein
MGVWILALLVTVCLLRGGPLTLVRSNSRLDNKADGLLVPPNQTASVSRIRVEPVENASEPVL